MVPLLWAGVPSGCGDDERNASLTTPTGATETTPAEGGGALPEESPAGGGDGPAGEDTEAEEPSGGIEPGTETDQEAESGGVDAPDSSGDGGSAGGVSPDPEGEDTPENDIQPEDGSPADAFEQFCEENPAAC